MFIKERIQVICDQLKKWRLSRRLPLTEWEYKDGNFIYPRDAEEADSAWLPFDSRTMHWYGPDAHKWFKTSFTVPPELDGKPLWLIVHTQIDEWDDAKNPQFLLFVDGIVSQGLDMNHREVLLTRTACAGQTYRLDLQAYTGTLHSDFRLIGEIAVLDEAVNALYYDLWMPLCAFSRMDEQDKRRIDIETVLNDTINLLDLRRPHSPEFARSVTDARAYIQKALYQDMAGCRDIVATCIGHTHIDVAWWWTVAQTREKVARSFATVLKLMEEYPEYRFMSSQPQLYLFLKERYPELYARVKQRVAEGRWEPEGGMWLEADCNLTSGESLVRQFLYGKRFFREEFGVDNRILWLPDVFGYSGALPQIMKKCGIDYFMTTKLSWNQINKIPADTLRWRGIDGTEVLAHFITTLGVGQEKEKFFTTYNGILHPDAIMGGWERYQNKDINHDILIAFGYGDGGGGPTREMLEVAQRMEKGVRGIPCVRQAFARRYFEELEQRVAGNRRLPVWVGEFYFEYHRGTYTSMARNKRANRQCEQLLMDLELLSVTARLCGLRYPREELEQMWKTVLLNQFHDILPGSSIREVYEVTREEYAQVLAQGQQLLHERLCAVAGEGTAFTVFNTLCWERDDMVWLDNVQADALADADGHHYPLQHTADGVVAYLRGLPAKGWRSYAPVREAHTDGAVSAFAIADNRIETPFYRAVFDENGFIASLYDKGSGREVFLEGAVGNRLCVYEDKPIYYDNWDIDAYYTEKSWDVTALVSSEWVENGPVMATLVQERRFSNSLLRQRIRFYAHSRRIDFETWVDWQESQQLLKVHFPVDVHADEATFDIQFGNVTRKTHKNTSWDQARFESCAHRWIDVSEGAYGVSLLNDCKYGHSVDGTDMALTLIKSGIEPNPTTDQEQHVFTYALYPHAGGWREARTPQEAAKLNQPVHVVRGGSVGMVGSLLRTDCPHAVVDTVKQAEDGNGVIVRIYENENTRARVCLTVSGLLRGVEECDLLEQPQNTLPHHDSEFSFVLRPYEIKTFRLLME